MTTSVNLHVHLREWLSSVTLFQNGTAMSKEQAGMVITGPRMYPGIVGQVQTQAGM
jgi:hypothetical protein